MKPFDKPKQMSYHVNALEWYNANKVLKFQIHKYQTSRSKSFIF